MKGWILCVVVQCGPGFKLALRTGEERFWCLSPVCGDCLFHIVKLDQSRALSALIRTRARGWDRDHDDDWHNTLQWTVRSFFLVSDPKPPTRVGRYKCSGTNASQFSSKKLYFEHFFVDFAVLMS